LSADMADAAAFLVFFVVDALHADPIPLQRSAGGDVSHRDEEVTWRSVDGRMAGDKLGASR